jgi:hypothetical protein
MAEATAASAFCVVNISHGEESARLAFGLGEQYLKGGLVEPSEGFSLHVEPVGQIASGYTLANWSAALVNGAEGAFSRLRATKRKLHLYSFTGKLSARAMAALNNAAARAVCLLLRRDPLPVQLDGWKIDGELVARSAES